MMRQLDIQGDFRIATLTAKEYNIKQFLMLLKAQNGVITIKPLSMQLLEGQVSSAVNLDVRKAIPAYAIQLDVNQLQVGPVVNPFLEGVMGDEPLKMEGAVNLTMDVKTAGETVNQLKKASKGQIVLDMKETAVDGFDPEFYMRKSIADYVNEKGFGLSKTIMGSYKPREVTVFDKIYSTVNLAGGKARTDDFLMDSKRVQIKADGYADIIQNKLDVNTSVRLPRGKTVAEKIFDEPLYVRVYGPFDALEYEIDKNRLKKSTTDVLEKEVKAKAKAKFDAEKQRLQEKADKELKRSEEKAKQKLQDKLKDKLKGLF
jgi:AsmA protein